MVKLRSRRLIHAAHLGSIDLSSQENAEFKIFLLRTNKEIAALPREHDRVVGGVDALLAESDRRFAEPFPRFPQVLGKTTGERCLGCGPAIVRCALLDPLFAVVALVARHEHIVPRLRNSGHGPGAESRMRNSPRQECFGSVSETRSGAIERSS